MDDFERKTYEKQLADQAAEIAQLKRDLHAEHERAEANAKAAAANAVEKVEASQRAIGAYKASPTAANLRRAVDALAPDGEAEHDPHANDPDALGPERERVDLHVTRETPNLTVHVREVHVEASPESAQGRVAILIADGFLDKGQKQVEVAKEIAARGGPDYRVNGGQRARLYEALLELAGAGFLRRSGPDWKVIPEAKARVRVVKEA